MTLDNSVMSVAIATVAKGVAFGVPVTILDNAPQLAAMMDYEISGGSSRSCWREGTR
jgi:hypothetical protein